VAVITDNARNMTLMKSYIKEKYPSIQGFGCSAHGLNLIIKDIIQIPNIQKLVQNSQSIVKEITDSNIKTSIFDEISNGTVKRLKLKTSTRYELVMRIRKIFSPNPIPVPSKF
jgi:hypothetical protein